MRFVTIVEWKAEDVPKVIETRMKNPIPEVKRAIPNERHDPLFYQRTNNLSNNSKLFTYSLSVHFHLQQVNSSSKLTDINFCLL